MKLPIVFCGLLMIVLSCKEKGGKTIVEPPETQFNGRQLAEIHCASCHSYVPPSALPGPIWQNDVLPAMGHRLGIFTGKSQPDSIFGSPANAAVVKMANIYPDKPLLAKKDWQKIVDYYVLNAPEDLSPPLSNPKTTMGLKHFRYREAGYGHRPPMTAMVKILPHKRGIAFGHSGPNNSVLTFLDASLELNNNFLFRDTPVHYHEKYDTLYLTHIGRNIFPNNMAHGSLQKIVFSPDQLTALPILAQLQRPVFMAYGDLDNDGKEDIVACEFGDLSGKLAWYKNQGNDRYVAQPLKNSPGAIQAIIKDYNKDGLKDIFVLMAQGDEGIFYFENQGNGTFKEHRLLIFSPLNGSQYFELADFNNDGLDDILYVCGDNADKTPILKPYHGIYIFLNDGNLHFEQAFFYPLNGAYKAVSRDFDQDGDLDIAAISYFPDYADHAEESFVYLENMGDLHFEGRSFPEATKGRWMVMDTGDIDEDGDIDIVLGSFSYFMAQGDTTGLGKKWLESGPSVILLENTIK